MQHIAQINYNAPFAQMFARLAQNMLNEELVAGAPVITQNEFGVPVIQQLYGQCPLSSGTNLQVLLIHEDTWQVMWEDGETSAILTGPEINKFLTGDF